MRLSYCVFLIPVVCLAQTSVPVISFEKTHHDFGKMSPGKFVSHKFNITNIGNAPLQIKEVRESCSCSKTMLPKHRLNPGESTFVEIHFNSSGMLGNVHKSITLISDDPVNPNVKLTFGASVVQEIMPSKSVVLFNEVSRYASVSSTIRLESGTDKHVEVSEVKIPVPYITCETQSEGNDVILNLSINGQLIPKERLKGSDTLTIRTTSKEIPTLQFVIEWDTMSVITASYKRIAWNGKAGVEMRTPISLNHSGGKAFKILDTQSTSPYLKVSGITKSSATEHKFDVIMTTQTKAGMYHEKLIIKLDDPEQSELEISVAAVLR
jgi:hypothetical protein